MTNAEGLRSYIMSKKQGNDSAICFCENHDMITQLRR